MYRCNRCKYKKACQGACGQKLCEGFESANKKSKKYAVMVELADTQDLESCGKPCEFKSH